MFKLVSSDTAQAQLIALGVDPALKKRYRAVSKALRLLAENPRHPGLNTHVWHSEKCPHGDKVFEAYAENHTPGAYRIFWCYTPGGGSITILNITQHP